jgi:hypothetical protein
VCFDEAEQLIFITCLLSTSWQEVLHGEDEGLSLATII